MNMITAMLIDKSIESIESQLLEGETAFLEIKNDELLNINKPRSFIAEKILKNYKFNGRYYSTARPNSENSIVIKVSKSIPEIKLKSINDYKNNSKCPKN